MPHCAGRKSFACVSAEEKNNNGVEPTRELFILVHKERKDGKPIDDDSDRAINALQQKLDELPDGKEQSQGKVAWEGDLYAQVIKRKRSQGKCEEWAVVFVLQVYGVQRLLTMKRMMYSMRTKSKN